MKKTLSVIITLTIVLLFSQDVNAQAELYNRIYVVFQTKCAGTSCHSPVSPNPLKLVGSTGFMFKSMVNVTPSNMAAANKGNKHIIPSEPQNSFILRKIDCNRGQEPVLDAPEGNCMPSPGLPQQLLSTAFVDTVRMWIANGADTLPLSINELAILNEPMTVTPNPFNDQLSIRFSLISSGNVTMEIFNTIGQRIATLMNAAVQPGELNKTFESSDLKIKEPGIYILKLTQNNVAATRKLIKLQ